MTPQRAAELQPTVAPSALAVLACLPIPLDATDAVFVHAGAPYRHALGDFMHDPRVTHAQGGMGS